MFSINFYFFLYTALIGSKHIFSFHDVYILHILRDCYHIPFNHPLDKLYIFSSFHLSYVLLSNSVGSSLNSFCQHLSGTDAHSPLINILGTSGFLRVLQNPLDTQNIGAEVSSGSTNPGSPPIFSSLFNKINESKTSSGLIKRTQNIKSLCRF